MGKFVIMQEECVLGNLFASKETDGFKVYEVGEYSSIFDCVKAATRLAINYTIDLKHLCLDENIDTDIAVEILEKFVDRADFVDLIDIMKNIADYDASSVFASCTRYRGKGKSLSISIRFSIMRVE